MPLCGRCNKPVYTAEEVLGAGKSWHKVYCFTCADCGKGLASTTLAEKEGEIYCKSCYGKNFGPKGYGYGGGAGTLNMDAGKDSKGQPQWAKNTAPATGGSTSKFGGSKKCPRCGSSVYAAEEMIAAGSSWHKSCFSCKSCSKRLDSTTVQDNEGEIYCKACYGKQFGPKGFGYGVGAGALTNAQ